MTDRASQLHATADGQITELLALTSTLNAATLRLPCPGREKLGDGTIAASLRHTANNYQRIAGFVQTSDRVSDTQTPGGSGAHRIQRFLRARGHRPANHAEHGPGRHRNQSTASDVNLDGVVEQLSAARDLLGRIADLSDSQLATIPPKASFSFCDGQRTLEQVLTGLLKHQAHQFDALNAARP